MKYYAQKEVIPDFKTFDEIDRNKLDLEVYAKEIYKRDMKRSERKKFTNSIWNDEDGVVRIYYNKKLYFTMQLSIEIEKIKNGTTIEETTPKVILEEKEIEKFTLEEIARVYPEKASEIKSRVFNKHGEKVGNKMIYKCNQCGKISENKVLFEIDHIKPMKWGGETVLENLQLLCRKCNKIKGDKYE